MKTWMWAALVWALLSGSGEAQSARFEAGQLVKMAPFGISGVVLISSCDGPVDVGCRYWIYLFGAQDGTDPVLLVDERDLRAAYSKRRL